jgi:DNA repair protein RAD50
MIKTNSPDTRREFERDLKAWESELEEYRALMPCESSVHRLKEVDIPSLETQIRAQDGLLPSLTEAAENVWHLTSFRL